MVNNNETTEDTITNSGFKDVPEWLNEKLFEQFVENDFPNYNKITKFSVKPAVQTGENYMTVMLRVSIEVELKDSTRHSTSYVIKIKPSPEQMQLLVKEWKVFLKEYTTYSKYIPAFEEYYQQAGLEVKFAPRLLEPTKSKIEDEHIILEDLKIKGFKNFNRRLGLDLVHTKAVLRKLAQFHAASAHYFNQCGPYPALYDQCLSAEKDMFADHRIRVNEHFREHLHLYGDFENLNEKLKIYIESRPDPYQLKSDWKANEFNVLNHGDCWINNIMFQYDKEGLLNETYLIDLQMSCYGSPAQDLIYFLLSSTNLEVKLKHFDYFICYYHEQLTEHLKIIKYEGKIPKLKDIHIDILKHDLWAYTTVAALTPIVLCEPRDDANIDALLNEDINDFKRSMYNNNVFIAAMKILLPWLNNRGAFDV